MPQWIHLALYLSKICIGQTALLVEPAYLLESCSPNRQASNYSMQHSHRTILHSPLSVCTSIIRMLFLVLNIMIMASRRHTFYPAWADVSVNRIPRVLIGT